MKFFLLTNMKIPALVGIFIFISREIPCSTQLSIKRLLICNRLSSTWLKQRFLLFWLFVCSNALIFISSQWRKRQNENSKESNNPKSQPFLTPKGIEKRRKPTRTKQTNARKSHWPDLSSPSELSTEKHKTKLNINRLVELTAKLHRVRATPGPRP